MTEDYNNGQQPVFEVKVMITIIGQDADLAALSNDIAAMSLSQIDNAIMEGDLIGASSMVSCIHLEEDEVVPALQKVGNDGEFFHHGADELFPMDGEKLDADARVTRTQSDQGWNEESLSLQRERFIDEMGLKDTFARWLEAEARAENEMAAGLSGPL